MAHMIDPRVAVQALQNGLQVTLRTDAGLVFSVRHDYSPNPRHPRIKAIWVYNEDGTLSETFNRGLDRRTGGNGAFISKEAVLDWFTTVVAMGGQIVEISKY
jgi:hypothetical protein